MKTQISTYVLSLDNEMKRRFEYIPKIDVLKIDVEGYEMYVLQGTTEVISQRPKYMTNCSNVAKGSRFKSNEYFNIV